MRIAPHIFTHDLGCGVFLLMDEYITEHNFIDKLSRNMLKNHIN